MESVPIYIKIGDHKEIMKSLAFVRQKIALARGILEKIEELKAKEDEIIASWSRDIDETEHWVADVNNTLGQEGKDRE